LFSSATFNALQLFLASKVGMFRVIYLVQCALIQEKGFIIQLTFDNSIRRMMETILPVILQLVGGAGGGNGIGALLKKISLGPVFNTIVGLIGGVGLGQLLKLLVPALGGSDLGGILSQLIGGGVGGGLLTIIVGFIRNLIAKK